MMDKKNFDRDYDWGRSLSERIRGMKDTALGMVWKKGREQRIKEIELLRAYNWLVSAGFPQYVQLHRDNVGTMTAGQVAEENKHLEGPMLDALLKRIKILNQHTKTKFLDTIDIQNLTGTSEDFNFSLSARWQFDRTTRRWTYCNAGEAGTKQDVSSGGIRKSGNEGCCTCQGELIDYGGFESRLCFTSSASQSPFASGSPARKPKTKKKNDGKKRHNKTSRPDEDGGGSSSNNTFPTPANSSLTSSDFKVNMSNCNNNNNNNNSSSSNHGEREGSKDRDSGKSENFLYSSALPSGREARFQMRKSSLQTELGRSANLRLQYKGIKNFFKSFGDRISSAKSSKPPKHCIPCYGNNNTKLTDSSADDFARTKCTTCSDSFLMSTSCGLPGIQVFARKDDITNRNRSENCLACSHRKRPGFNVRCSRFEASYAKNKTSIRRRSATPTSGQSERTKNSENNNTLLSLEMPRRRFSNSSSCSPKVCNFVDSSPKLSVEPMKLSPFRKMSTVPDKMERLSGEVSPMDMTIPFYFTPSEASTRHFSAADGKSTTDDSSYYDCFEESSNCCLTSSDNASGALFVEDKGTNFESSSIAGSQSEESQQSSYQSLEASKSFRQKELDVILKELYNKINALDKIRFTVESANQEVSCPCSSNQTDQIEDDKMIFKTFSIEKAKFFNIEQDCMSTSAQSCQKCHRRPISSEKESNSNGHPADDLTASSPQGAVVEPEPVSQTSAAQTEQTKQTECRLEREFSLLSASELFVLRKVSLIHLTSITDKYFLSNVDNLLAPKPDLRLSERRDSTWTSAERKQKIFGCSLVDIIKNMCQPLPSPIGRALAWLGFVGGDAVGIFRRPGVKSRIVDIKTQLDRDPDFVDFHSLSVYDIADLVKLYFRELPGSLFTKEYSQLLIDIFSYVPKELHLSSLRDVMCLLPDENRLVLKLLLTFLQKLSKSSGTNQMDISNLATCFAPSLFYSTNQNADLNDDPTGGQGCWDRNGAANGKKGQTMPLHHSHPHPASHRNAYHQSVHHTNSNSADYVREATEMKDHKASKECLTCLISNAHLVFQVSDEISHATSHFITKRSSEPNFSDMLSNKEDSLSTFLKDSICCVIQDVDNNLAGWFPITDLSPNVEVYYKPDHDGCQTKEGVLLGTFVASSFIPVDPREAMRRIAREREQWDDTLLSWKVLEEVSGIDVNESDLKAAIQADISRMTKNSDIPTIIEENVAGFSGKFDWNGILNFGCYSGDLVHYTVAFAPDSDLEFCEMRLWQTSDDNSISLLLSTSVKHPTISSSSDVICHVIDCRYVVASVDEDTSKLYFFSRVDIKGHLPSWYEKVYGHLCANHVKKLLASFEENI